MKTAVDRQRDIQSVIDDERHVIFLRHTAQHLCFFQKIARRNVLFPELDDGCTAEDRSFNDIGEPVTRTHTGIRDQIKRIINIFAGIFSGNAGIERRHQYFPPIRTDRVRNPFFISGNPLPFGILYDPVRCLSERDTCRDPESDFSDCACFGVSLFFLDFVGHCIFQLSDESVFAR